MSDKLYFNVRLQFDKDIVNETIQTAIIDERCGYVCVIESNNLTVANTNSYFLTVINNALINICDGSNLARLLGIIHKQKFTSYIGTNIFSQYVQMCRYRQYFLGNTQEVLDGLKENLSKVDPKVQTMCFDTLPFCNVEEFDYQGIADKINADAPDIIWVSLGAPKQEIFMSKLKPFLYKGVMFGIGAAFNFNSGGVGPVRRAPQCMLALRMEWLYRALEEPKKNVPRYYHFLQILPRLIKEEKLRISHQ